MTILICHYLYKQKLQKYLTSVIISFIISVSISIAFLVTYVLYTSSDNEYNPESTFRFGISEYGKNMHNLAGLLQWLSLIGLSVYYYITSIQMKNFKHLFNDLME